MTRKKCKVLGCREDYEYTCKFSFYGVTTTSELPPARDEWIEGALRGDARSLWHEVCICLCRVHYADSTAALWLESPALRHLMAVDFGSGAVSEPGKSGNSVSDHANAVNAEHAYSRSYTGSASEISSSATARAQALIKGKLNVRDLLDNVSYMSRKAAVDTRLWVVGVRGDGPPGCVSETHEVVRRVEDDEARSPGAEEVVFDDGVVANDVYYVDKLEPFEEVVIKMESQDDDEETTVPDDLVYEYHDPDKPETADWIAQPQPESRYDFITHEKVSRYKEKCIRRTHRRQSKAAGNGLSTMRYYTEEYPYHDPSKTIEVSIEEVHLPPPKQTRSEVYYNNVGNQLVVDKSKNKKYILNLGNEDEIAANSILPKPDEDPNQATTPQQQVYILKRPIQKKNVIKVKPKRASSFVRDFKSHDVKIETDIYVPDVVASEQYVTCVPYIEMKNIPGSIQIGDTISVVGNAGEQREEIVLEESGSHEVSGGSGYQLSLSHDGKNVVNLLECHNEDCEKAGSDEREIGVDGQVRSSRVRKKKRKFCACDCGEA